MRRRALPPALLFPSLAAAEPEAVTKRAPTLVTPFPPSGIVDTARRLLAPAEVCLGHNLRARFNEFVMDAQFQTGPELTTLLDMETRLWGGLIRDAGIRAQ